MRLINGTCSVIKSRGSIYLKRDEMEAEGNFISPSEMRIN